MRDEALITLASIPLHCHADGCRTNTRVVCCSEPRGEALAATPLWDMWLEREMEFWVVDGILECAER